MSDEGVCRTAPATPGLLIIIGEWYHISTLDLYVNKFVQIVSKTFVSYPRPVKTL